MEGDEDLGPVGKSAFSARLSRTRGIVFNGSVISQPTFEFFQVKETPFSATVTDLSGRSFRFQKALMCDYGQSFSSVLHFKMGETSELTVPVSKIRSISLRKLEATSEGGFAPF
ncbi:MAG: hypothetical protein V2A71_05825 [Candidatus Eisenbacteria bacterium]